VILFFVVAVARYWDVLQKILSSLDIRMVFVIGALWSIGYLILSLSLRLTAKLCGEDVRYTFALKTYAENIPHRYLPGGIWQTVGRAAAFYRAGMRTRTLPLIFVLENVFAVNSSLMFGGAIIVFALEANKVVAGWIGLIVLLMLGIFMIIPVVLSKYLRRSFSGKDYHLIFAIYGTYAAIWGIYSLSFYLYLNSFSQLGYLSSYIQTAGAYMFSVGVGYLAIFAPQGVGVMEAVYNYLSPLSVGFGAGVAILVGYRACVVVGDFISWSIYLIYTLVSRRTMRMR